MWQLLGMLEASLCPLSFHWKPSAGCCGISPFNHPFYVCSEPLTWCSVKVRKSVIHTWEAAIKIIHGDPPLYAPVLSRPRSIGGGVNEECYLWDYRLQYLKKEKKKKKAVFRTGTSTTLELVLDASISELIVTLFSSHCRKPSQTYLIFRLNLSLSLNPHPLLSNLFSCNIKVKHIVWPWSINMTSVYIVHIYFQLPSKQGYVRMK